MTPGGADRIPGPAAPMPPIPGTIPIPGIPAPPGNEDGEPPDGNGRGSIPDPAAPGGGLPPLSPGPGLAFSCLPMGVPLWPDPMILPRESACWVSCGGAPTDWTTAL